MAANSPDVQSLLRQSMEALTRGDKPTARDLLTSVLEMDDRNEQAWLWLSGAVDSPAEQRICLENVLTINPGSTAARQGLAYLDKIDASTPPAPAPAPAAPEPPALPSWASPDPGPAAALAAPPAGPGADAGPAAPLPAWAAPGEAAPSAAPAWGGAPAVPPTWAAPAAPLPPAWGAPAALAPAAGPAPGSWEAAPAGAPAAGPAGAADPWAALRAEALPADQAGAPAPAWGALPAAAAGAPAPAWGALPAAAGSPGPPGNGTPAPTSGTGSWMDAYGGSTANPLATAAGPPRGAGAGPAPAVDTFGGVQPFDFEVPAATPGADALWGNVEAAVPGLAVPSAPDNSLPNLPPDSPWAGAFTGGLGVPAVESTEDPFLHIRQAGNDPGLGSSPALISRPPIGGRVVAVPTIPCPNCGDMVSENALSCPRCNYRFYAPCPNCGDFIDTSAPNAKGKDVCPHCEQPVDKLALGQEPVRGARRSAAPEAKAAAPAKETARGKKARRGKAPPVDPRMPAALLDQPPEPAVKQRSALSSLIALVVILVLIGAVIFYGTHFLPANLTLPLTPGPLLTPSP
ncbi:MAG TPA: zinc ribbon domain-containing protein [Chloroflexia bacterium]|nr:zinc ribbon domain-containing protein [Chloroflexia bacterium]